MTTATNNEAIIREFLALPADALPSAQITSDGDSIGTAWELLRESDLRLGETVRLHADRDGWRDGVTIDL